MQVVYAFGIGMLWPQEAQQQPLLAAAKAAALALIATFVYWRAMSTSGGNDRELQKGQGDLE